MRPGMPDRWGGGLFAVVVLLALVLILMLFSTAPARAQGVPPDFAGFGWGVGFAFTDSLRADLVDPEDVTVDEKGFLSVARFNNVSAGLVLESHVTFQLRRSVAVGPYFSVTPDTENLVKAVGLGILFELNRPQLNPVTNQFEPSPVSFNIGVGVNIIFDATLLRPGFVDGVHVPNNQDPTVTRERAVLQLMSTVGF